MAEDRNQGVKDETIQQPQHLKISTSFKSIDQANFWNIPSGKGQILKKNWRRCDCRRRRSSFVVRQPTFAHCRQRRIGGGGVGHFNRK